MIPPNYKENQGCKNRKRRSKGIENLKLTEIDAKRNEAGFEIFLKLSMFFQSTAACILEGVHLADLPQLELCRPSVDRETSNCLVSRIKFTKKKTHKNSQNNNHILCAEG